MNRRLWSIVILVVGVMVVAAAGGAPDRLQAIGEWVGAGKEALSSLVINGHAIEAALGALAGPAALVVLALTIGLAGWRRRRRTASGLAEPWRTVIEMGRKGGHPAAIAQATGLAQDAVRIVLAPIDPDGTLPMGKSFRTSSPGRNQPSRSAASRALS